MSFTSYEIGWRRREPIHRPDFDTRPHSEAYENEEGLSLFTVSISPGIPSEGIFTLIEHAPRLRNELDRGEVGWHDAGRSVYYAWERLKASRNPLEWADAINNLSNAMSDLATWLPGYDLDTGTLREPEA